MSTELAKAFDPASAQSQALDLWNQANAYHAEPTDPGQPYSIVIPPPNVTAALHLGHALNNTLQDILTRWHRMAGDNTCWLPGTDHAGIATQTVVDKRLQAEGQPALKDYKLLEAKGENGREKFLEKVTAWKDEYERRITDQLKAMGCSCDWDRQAFTMDPARAKAVREAFYRLFADGLIYRGKRLVNWDPVSQTALADDEVENEEIDGNFYFLRYPLTDGSGHVTVATTRPETMLGDTAVAINPKDPRAAALKGKSVLLPIVNRPIPIIEDDYVVMPVQYGGDPKDPKAALATGFLKVTPAHDPNDYEIGQRHNLPIINVFSPTATISKDHGWPAEDAARADAFLGELLGKDRFEARTAIVKWFKAQGLHEETKPYRHSVGHSYRSHVPIEPYLSDQWYCKVTDERLAGAALKAMAADQREGAAEPRGTGYQPVRQETSDSADSSLHGQVPRATWEGGLRFYPARYAKTFQTWHENIRDWCISRQLWWGHRIPVWYFRDDAAVDSKSDEELAALIRRLVVLRDTERVALQHAPGAEASGKAIDLQHSFVCVRAEDDAEAIDLLAKLGFVQDPDVLDTWFSSGLWPMSTLNWPDRLATGLSKSALNVWNPTSVLCTAREIITLWVSRMVMFNLYFLNRLPFRDVFIHAMIQDGHGQKMSKTLGNGLDPMDIIASHGADALRFAMAHMATTTQDVRMPVDIVDPHTGESFTPKFVQVGQYMVAAPVQDSPKDPKKKMVSSYGYATGKAQPTPEMPLAKNTSSKFDLGRNFANKLWNASRFVLSNIESAPIEVADETKWSLADRWIVSRFNRTVEEINAALKEYRFDNYARAAYDFFWRDFCDWYVEAVKPAMKDPARAGQTARVLASVLEGTLRLLHPMIPFITEVIWQRLGEVRPARGLPGRIESSTAPLLIRAAWPGVGSFSEAAEHIFPKVQEVITAIRNTRNQAQISPKQKVTVSVTAPAEPTRQLIENREVIEFLTTCTLAAAGPEVGAPAGAIRTTAAGLDVYVDIGKSAPTGGGDAGVNAKRVAELTKQAQTLRGRLSNEAYIAKAPVALVQQTRDQLAQVEAELARLQG